MSTNINIEIMKSLIKGRSLAILLIVIVVYLGVSSEKSLHKEQQYIDCVEKCDSDGSCMECDTKYGKDSHFGNKLKEQIKGFDKYPITIVDDRDYPEDCLEIWIGDDQVGHICPTGDEEITGIYSDIQIYKHLGGSGH